MVQSIAQAAEHSDMQILELLSRIQEAENAEESTSLLNGLEVGYEFEDNILDVTGNGHDLTDRSGGTPVQFVDGLVGRAARFSRAQHNFLIRQFTEALRPGDDFTIVVEFKAANLDIATAPYLFALTGGDDQLDQWVLWVDNGQAGLGHTPPSLAMEVFYPNMTAEVITTGTWYFVIGWKEGNKVYHQINGGSIIQADAPSPYNLSSTNPAIEVGGYDFAPAHFSWVEELLFEGDIGCLFYWPTRALSASERAELWNGGTRKQYPFD
jgi:hypothetical protein